jgi:hypothetical protein
MGYRVDTSALLVLEAYGGAEVTVNISLPLHALLAWADADTVGTAWPIFVEWARPAWNLEDADGAIPADEDAIKRLPLPMVKVMMRAWRDAAVNPPAPLPQPSGDTEP